MKKEKKDLSGLTRREFLYLSGAGVAGMTMAGIQEPGYAAEKKPKYGGRLRIGERYGSTGLDAHKNQWFIDFQNYLLMYNGLTIMGPLPDTAVFPDLAKSWEISKDGREYIFTLGQGVKFHHGKELDSGDVKYSIERVMNPVTRSPRAFAYRWIDSVQVIDKYHVKIKLKEPFGPFLTTLTIQNCPIIPAGVEPTGTKPAPGTGPFVLKSFVPNETTEFTRFDKYWEHDEKTGNRLPYLDSIHVRKILEDVVRWTALRAEDLDYINGTMRKMVVEEMKKPTPGLVVVPGDPVAVYFLAFNFTKPPFDNKKVRQAIAYASDKNELIKGAYWGLAEAVTQSFSRLSRMYIPVEDRKVDLNRARQLLAEAGYPNGFKTEILVNSNQIMVDGANVIAGQFQKIGIDATIKVMDRAPYTSMMIKGDYLVSFVEESQRLDPDDAYYLWLHSGEIGKNNWPRYSNKELDALLETGRTTWKWEDRVPVYKKAVEIIHEELPILPLVKPILPIAWRDYVKGHGGGCSSWFIYYGGGMKYVWLDK